ncbi:hypothetical protein HHI36_008503 [Cryptolaemus montrouzieri]|uniref:Huntingtin n=1 Tax=Cryptolaemus montrouzieri TaxID=559131 RepID=A0ABD2MSL8_9CUCU
MATQEKLLKSLEILRKLTHPDNADSGNFKKDKIQHCHVITDYITSPTLQASSNFSNILNYTMETLFQICDDSDSDIRMVAEECLNKIIKAFDDEHITKILIELHKEIKRNGPARSLRAALSRFAKLAHYIRPQKGKPYVVNLFPSLSKIVDRSEEAVHETLSNSLPHIIEVLGSFATDNDIKNLLKSFMANISNPSTVIKRTTANSIQNICLNCQKPYSSIIYCIHIVLGFMFPLNENCDSHLILGVLGVLKILLPHWRKLLIESSVREGKEKLGSEWGELKTDKLQQIYELCLYYVNHKDHNIVNFSLETLNILLQSATRKFEEVLLDPGGLTEDGTHLLVPTKQKSASQLSIASSVSLLEKSNPLESDLTDSLRPDIAKWMDESKLSLFDTPMEKSNDSQEHPQSLESSSSNTIARSFSQINLGSSTEFDAKNQENSRSRDDLELSTNSSVKSFSYEDTKDIFRKEQCSEKPIDIGHLFDQDVALKYCGRLLVKSFLLTGVPAHLITDKNCRISVKSSAISCLSSILRLYPKFLHEYLDKRVIEPEEGKDQTISEILSYSSHSDPQLRGYTRILIANYIVSVVTQSRGQYNNWIKENLNVKHVILKFEELTSIFVSGLEDQSSLCIRLTLQGLELCMRYILESEQCQNAIPILFVLPELVNNPYWLVKVNLCSLLCSLPFITIHYVLDCHTFQNKILFGIIYELLKDGDVRVRNASSNTLVKLIPELYFEDHMCENTVTSKAVSYRKILLSGFYDKRWLNPSDFKQFVETMPSPFSKINEKPNEDAEIALSKVVADICKLIMSSNCKHILHGCLEALASLSQKFPCITYRLAWNCFITREQASNDTSNDLLKLCVSLMTNLEFVYDISFHLNLLVLSSNLYAGYSISILRPITEEDDSRKWNMFESSDHRDLSESFMKHLVKILSIYQHVIDDLHLPSQHSKPIILSLPTASPIKRRKSDLEKKFINPSKILEEKNERREKEKNMVGAFSHERHYINIYDAIRTAYKNYKTSLDHEASEKFLNMLKESLKSLSVLMELGSLSEFGGIAEEILNYLNSIFRIEPSATVECVQQLLKAIFSTNLLANGLDILQELDKSREEETITDANGFYYQMFLKPYNEVSMCINSLKDINKIECDGDNTVMGYLHRTNKRKAVFTRNLDKVLANYIRIFEPMVIKSLKQYTITSDVILQGQVLQLLSQLVQLKINYCLLDAEQTFIKFVINQFEYIEEGKFSILKSW